MVSGVVRDVVCDVVRGVVGGGGGSTPAPEPPTNGLLSRIVAGTGETVSGGRVTNIADQSGNSIDGISDGSGPYKDTDWLGRDILRFIDGDTGTMTLGALESWSARDLNVYLVVGQRGAGNISDLSDYALTAALHRIVANTTDIKLYSIANATTISPEANPMFWGELSSATRSKVVTNTVDSGDLAVHVADTSLTGVVIGGLQGNDSTLDVYECLIYDDSQTSGEIDDVKTYANSAYSLRSTAWDKVLVCVGDSNTQGVGDVVRNNGNYPQLVLEGSDQSWKIVNNGVAGNFVSSLVAREDATDSFYDAGKSRNVLVANIGRNDATVSSGEVIYNNMVAYLTDRVAAGWEVWVTTTIAASNGTVNARIQDYNERLRGNIGSGIIADSGADRLIDVGAESVFDEATDTANATYYQSDATHTTKVGSGVWANLVITQMGL